MLEFQHLDLAGADTYHSHGDISNDGTGLQTTSTLLATNPAIGALTARSPNRRLSEPSLGTQVEPLGLLNINAASTKLDQIDDLAATLEKTELFRGITYAIQGGKPYSHQTPEGKSYSTDNSRDTFNALKAMVEEGEGHFPVMWGFRQYTPGEDLTAKEMKTLQSLATMFKDLEAKGVKAHVSLILADRHAEHNRVPAEGVEGYRAYYEKVRTEAEKLGIPSNWLSEIFDKLGIDAHGIAEHGKTLVRKSDDFDKALAKPEADVAGTKENNLKRLAQTRGTPEYEKASITAMSNTDYGAFKGQARNMATRYPGANADILKLSNKKREDEFGKRGVEYAQFRAGEGDLLLPNLDKFYGTRAVLPIHVAEPEAAKIGVRGLSVFSKGANGENVTNIPWKSDEIAEKEQEKKLAKEAGSSSAQQTELDPAALLREQKKQDAKRRQQEALAAKKEKQRREREAAAAAAQKETTSSSSQNVPTGEEPQPIVEKKIDSEGHKDTPATEQDQVKSASASAQKTTQSSSPNSATGNLDNSPPIVDEPEIEGDNAVSVTPHNQRTSTSADVVDVADPVLAARPKKGFFGQIAARWADFRRPERVQLRQMNMEQLNTLAPTPNSRLSREIAKEIGKRSNPAS